MISVRRARVYMLRRRRQSGHAAIGNVEQPPQFLPGASMEAITQGASHW
jgi:hypothetical protein